MAPHIVVEFIELHWTKVKHGNKKEPFNIFHRFCLLNELNNGHLIKKKKIIVEK